MKTKKITVTLDCKGKKVMTSDTKVFFVQDNTIIDKVKLQDNKTFKRDIIVNCDEKLYVCTGDDKADIEAETEEYALDCDDTLSMRFFDRLAFAMIMMIEYLLFDIHEYSCIKAMYQYCVIHEINIEKYDEFKFRFHGDEGRGVYYFTSKQEDSIKLHFWDTDVKRDFKHYTYAYILHLIILILIGGIAAFYAITGGVKILFAITAIAAILSILSLIRIPRKIIREYRHVKNALENEVYRESRMEDVLHIALWGEDKKLVLLTSTNC